MIIGVPKEIKDKEYRVSLTPAGCASLIKAKNRVLIESGAGTGCGFADNQYLSAGGEVLGDKKRLFRESEIIIKVKEPVPEEYKLLKPGLIIFTFLHLASNSELTNALIDTKVAALGYETVETDSGHLPLLTPMSEVAGKLAVQIGANYLRKDMGGSGVLLGGATGVQKGHVAVIGGGVVGINAARMALGLGAGVTVLDIDLKRLGYLDNIFSGRMEALISNLDNIEGSVEKADLLVGAVLMSGARTPVLVSEDMVKRMRPGSVIVDVSVDQGGCVATTRPTTHTKPIFKKHGVIHYGVTNMPAVVPRTATLALTNSTLPYIEEIASLGLTEAIERDSALKRAVNILNGNLVHAGVAHAHNLPLAELSS